MEEQATVDKHLEVRLFDLLERRAGVRLGQLVQLRRLSRQRNITLLRAALDAGQVAPDVAEDIAQVAGLSGPAAPPPSVGQDRFGDLPRLNTPSETPSAEAIALESIDISIEDGPPTDLHGFEFDGTMDEPIQSVDGPPPIAAPPPPAAPSLPPPLPMLQPPPAEPRPIRETAELFALGDSQPPAHQTVRMEVGLEPAPTVPELDTIASWTGDTEPPTGTEDDSSVELELPDSGDRYALGPELGRGGMGQVLEAQDLSLHRSVAIKLLFDQDDASMRLRFVDEARFTGQLQHPGVPPVYELGRLGDGRMFFAMKRLEGRTLRDVLEDMRHGDTEVIRAFGRVRLLTIFSQVCRTIAYAHSRGLMHRDLKPDNVMLGEFGEVTVMDWGLAKPFDAPADGETAELEDVVAPRTVDGRFSTQAGQITGTPHYMPPEQAAGRIEDLGPHSDVYSLGAVLYELLTGEPPYDGPSTRRIRDAVVSGKLVAPSDRSPERNIPTRIEALCVACLAVEPERRPRGAAWVADEVDRFLEGEQDRARKAAERDALLTQGQEATETFFARLDEHRQRQNRVAVGAARIAPWASLEDRRRLWAEEDGEQASRVEAARAMSEALASCHAALAVDRDHAATRHALARLYYGAFEVAERDGDHVQMAQYEHLVRAFDPDGSFGARLEGDGRLAIETSPRGLDATLLTYAPVDRVLTPTDPRPLGRTPVQVEPLPMGSYLLRLQGPGLSARTLPVQVGRTEAVTLRVRLFPDSVVGAEHVHVAGGPCRLGGDPLAQLAAPATTVEVDDFFVASYNASQLVDDFFIARGPVTCEAYLDFLYDVARTEGPQAARARIPRGSASGPPLWPVAADGAPEAIPDRDEQGQPWSPEWPVVCVSCEDAEAYCAWLTRQTGVLHRLPSEAEWEKAARGVDGRLFPWGDAWAPMFCHMGISRDGAPSRGPIGSFAADVSPYGVRDMAGGVSEWTRTWLDAGQRQRVVKGGHWASGPTECRAASRFTQPVHRVSPTLGFRVVREAPR